MAGVVVLEVQRLVRGVVLAGVLIAAVQRVPGLLDKVVMAALDQLDLVQAAVVKIKPVGTALLIALVVRVEMVWHG